MQETDRNKVTLITGGASGIGLAVAQDLLDRDRRVVIVDRDGAAVETAAASLRTQRSHQLHATVADVTDEARIEAVVTHCETEFGPISGLVNSAGIAAETPAMDTDVETFRRIMDVNVTGSFIVARTVARAMQSHGGGSIVFLASVSGMRGNYGRVAYGSSKSALLNMTRVLAVEWAPLAIRVNAVAPGPVETPLTREVHSPQTRKNWRRVVAMGRYGELSEMAGPIHWLLDETASSYVTGQVIAVDGGFTAMGLPVPQD